MITWSQKEGFSSVEGILEWGDDHHPESEVDWLQRIGAKEQESFGSEFGDRVRLFVFDSDKKDFWGLVLLETANRGQEIFVRTEADFVALRILLVPPLIASMDQTARSLESLAEWVFRIWHGHDVASFCVRCSPEAWHKMQEKKKRNVGSDA